MDPLVRQASLEILLSRAKELTEEELVHAIRLGLTDPDPHINHVAWKYMRKNKLQKEFLLELQTMIDRFKEGDDFYSKLASVIERSLM